MSNGIMFGTVATAWQTNDAQTAAGANAFGDAQSFGGMFGGQEMGGMADLLRSFADMLQTIADQMDGGGQRGPWQPTPMPGPMPESPIPSQPEPDYGEPIAGSGRIWGDPHFIGADGGKYDVQGEDGKTYNLLSDKDFQMNGLFGRPEGTARGTTVVEEVGINAGDHQIEVHAGGEVIVDGRKLQPGERVELSDGGYVSVSEDGKDVEVKHGEWKVDFDVHDKRLDMSVSTSNAISDGVKPHGLLGQTFDGDGEARNGDKGKGRQGGGAIEDADGNITERGDRTAVESYEVDGLHDQSFQTHNQSFDAEGSMLDEQGGLTAEQQQMMDQMMQQFVMMAFSMMAQMQQQMAGQMQQAGETEAA